MARVTFNMARDVIVSDTHAIRFENFCNGIVSAIEGGVVIHRTSQTWDRGRDGKTVGPLPRVIVCSSLNDWPEDKAISDIAKVVANCSPLPDRVYFCSSQELSEQREDKIAAEIGAAVPEGVSVEVLDAKHLAEFAARLDAVLERHYPTELKDIRTSLAQDREDDGQAANAALHLALCAMGHKDSLAVRNDTYRAAL